jgi:uncharacterized protein (TIGR01777 family)
MNILISGASGLIGKALSTYLSKQGHQVFKLNRGSNTEDAQFHWQPELGKIHLDDSIKLDAVINLCGVNIGDRPWSQKRKNDIIESRVVSTTLLSKALCQLKHQPATFINASAIGFYGNSGDIIVDESSPQGNNFLTDIVTQWESSTQTAIDAGIRTLLIRSGIVLSANAGALQKMLLPFKLGLGGRVGSGKQYMSWIALEDEIRAIEFLLNNPSIEGPVNLCSPNAVTNTEFTQTLGNVLKRPTIFPLPALMVRIIFGEMGQKLLLEGCRVHPKILTEAGFEFDHPTLEEGLKQQLKHNG